MTQGKALNAVASPNVKVMVVGNPCNTKYGKLASLHYDFCICQNQRVLNSEIHVVCCL